jgi:outer membrane lipoprotein-sorting protein
MHMIKRNLHSVTGLLLAAAFLLFLSGPVSSAQAGELTAEDILNHVDDMYRGTSSDGKMTMAIVTENWSRTLTLEFWSKGKDKSLIKILSPKKEAGTATLRVGNEIWNYLPKVNRTIKIPSSMMSQSWMGSHFTNDDLVRESRMADDYDFTKTFEGKRDGQDIIEITCIPKPNAAVVWGKVVVTVTANEYMPTEILYYNEGMSLVRTMTFSDIQKLSDRKIPMKMVVQPTDKPDESTTVTYDSLTFDVNLGDSFFSLRNLESS